MGLDNQFSPQYRRFRPSARSSTQLRVAWSSSSSASKLFDLPIEILERVLYFLSPDLVNFALVNSDCQYLASPLQFRCLKVRFSSDERTPYRNNHGVLSCLLGVILDPMVHPKFSMASCVRYLHLKGGDFGCEHITGLDSHDKEVFSINPDLAAWIQTLNNLEALSYHMPALQALRLTASFMLALMRSSIKHVAFRGALFPNDEVHKLQSEGAVSWPVETLTIMSPWNIPKDHPENVVPSLLLRACSGTIKQLTLDCWNAFDLLTEQEITFPALEALYLDPTLGPGSNLTHVLNRQPALISLQTNEACAVNSISTLRRYACSINNTAEAQQVVQNLRWNPQVECLNIKLNEHMISDSSTPDLLINTISGMPQLRALRIEGYFPEDPSTERKQQIATMSLLQNLQLMGLSECLEFRNYIASGSMQSLEWLSIDCDDNCVCETLADCFPIPTLLPPHVWKRIDVYWHLFEAELYAALLPSLRGCILHNMPIAITDGKAQALCARACTHDEVDRLLDHNLSVIDMHLWHWD